ncbi:hypothetical protein CTAYLR_007471 [Chrysophaeum taylorii]|uniref:Uncharacterized protein n=1 Tax=Chrysophaeum taylorii TaxID=2483200 RepID=A0AAD7UBS5_9STRA|nr:hypothetical protein CTAYLR_007471 [Chrysophaeum taylorii]
MSRAAEVEIKPAVVQQAPEAVVIGDEEQGLNQQGAAAAEAVPVASQSDVKERPRAVISSAVCCCLLIAFLLVFLFIPRSPSVRLRSLDIEIAGNTVEKFEAKIDFNSRSLVDMDWRKLEFELDWLQNENGDRDRRNNVAEFERSKSFSTASYGDRDLEVSYSRASDIDEAQELRNHCALYDEAVLRIKGSVRSGDSKLKFHSDWDIVRC